MSSRHHNLTAMYASTLKSAAIFCVICLIYSQTTWSLQQDLSNLNHLNKNVDKNLIPCVCGVYLSGQFEKGQQPKGNPCLLQEYDTMIMNNTLGTRQCVNRCLEGLVKHLSKSADIICATIDRDCHKERAYLFVRTSNTTWINSNLSAGREYCCKDHEPYKC